MSRSAISLVARREIAERLRGRLMIVLTATTTLLVVAAIVLPAILGGPSKPTVIGLVGPPAQAVGPALQDAARAAKVKVRLVEVSGDSAGQAAVRKGALDVALTLGARAAVADVKETLSPTIAALLASVVSEAHQRQALAQTGLPVARILPALARFPLATAALSPTPPDQAGRDIAALAAALLMYMSLGIYGAAVANGVAQEKTSRTAEVLLGALRPRQLLVGKVVGIGLCGLGQLGITVVAGLIANLAVGGTDIPSSVWGLLPAILLWFLLGFTFYAFAFAAAGALVARQEEVQVATTPLSVALIGGYLLVYAAIASPDAWWIRLLSFLPPLAPTLMPARIALGHVAAWEVPVDVVAMVAAIYGIVRLAAGIYSSGLVRGGARLSWRAALRSARD